MNKRKILKHLIISIILFYILIILGALLNVSENEIIFNVSTFLLFIDGLYIIISFILLMITIIKCNKSKLKKEKDNNVTYYNNLNNNSYSKKICLKEKRKNLI